MLILLQPCLTRPCEMRFGQWHVHSVSKFPGEPIENILACLSSSWDPGISLGGFIRHDICDIKDDDDVGSGLGVDGQSFPSFK